MRLSDVTILVPFRRPIRAVLGQAAFNNVVLDEELLSDETD
jgi:hypothetical protein